MSRHEHSGAAAPARLATGISDADTTMVCDALAGYWPTGATNPFYVVVDRGTTTEEKIECQSRSGVNIAVLNRGADGTTPVAHSADAVVEHCLTAVEFDAMDEHKELTTAHGTTTAVVGVDDAQTLKNKVIDGVLNTLQNIDVSSLVSAFGGYVERTKAQTLTNKTLTRPAVTDFTLAGHDHSTVGTAGLLAQASTHESPDTDTGAGSLHHTLGAGALQAAAGNHGHRMDLCVVRMASSDSMTSGAFNTLTFDADLVDTTGDMHSPVTNTSRVYCRTSGTYRLVAAISTSFSSATTYVSEVYFQKNGTLLQPVEALPDSPTMSAALVWNLAEGDYVEVRHRSLWAGGTGTRVANCTFTVEQLA